MGQFGSTGVQEKVMCLKLRSVKIKEGVCGGVYGAANNSMLIIITSMNMYITCL